MVLVTLVAVLAGAAPDKPSCVNINGTTACGFACKAEGGNAKCAKTPQGICASSGGQILCFDPPPIVAEVMKAVPAPECKVEQGKLACGYHCTSAMSELRCTKTPAGVCEARYGKTVCFDPPDEVFAIYGADVPPPKCISAEGHIACGYNCTSGSGGTVACTTTPMGVCLARDSAPKCFDPSREVICAYGRGIQRPECKYESGLITCGYDCKATGGKMACAQTPKGSCSDGAGGITCFDPPLGPGEASACFTQVAGRP